MDATFNERLRQEMQRFGYTDETLEAATLEKGNLITARTIKAWRNNTSSNPQAINLITLSKTLGVSVDYLLCLCDERTIDTTIKSAAMAIELSEEALEIIKICDKTIKDFISDFFSYSYGELAYSLFRAMYSYMRATVEFGSSSSFPVLTGNDYKDISAAVLAYASDDFADFTYKERNALRDKIETLMLYARDMGTIYMRNVQDEKGGGKANRRTRKRKETL